MKNIFYRKYAKLTCEQVLIIKNLLKNNDVNQTQLATEFNVCRATINRIANNKMWEDVK